MERKQPEQITTISSIIKDIIKEKGISQADLAQMLGYNTQSAVSERLRGDIRISKAIRMLNSIGCDLVVVDRKSGDHIGTVEMIPTPVQSDKAIPEK